MLLIHIAYSTNLISIMERKAFKHKTFKKHYAFILGKHEEKQILRIPVFPFIFLKHGKHSFKLIQKF